MSTTVRVQSYNGARYTYPGTVVMVTITCANCGVIFALPDHLEQQLRNNGTGFYCPHGHSLTFGETEVDRLKRRLASTQEDERIAWALAAERRKEAEQERRRHGATKGQLTKTRKRIAAGVCPCCNRTFQQLARHMAGQHPDYSPHNDEPNA